MMSVRWVRSMVLALGMSVGVGSVASAQPPAAASQHAESVATRHTEDNVRLALTAGTALTYGNSRNFAVNLGGDFLLRLGQHALTAQIGWIYGMASLQPDLMTEFEPWREGTNNLTWKLRYDVFLTDDDALFAVHHGRRDPFAQLDPRIGFQVGYMRNFVNEDKHRFWGEIGYDFTYDRFGDMPLDVGDGQMSTDRALHSARLFIGYDNRLNDVLTYTTGLQALMRVDRPEHWRFEWTNQLRSKLADWLQVSLDVTARLDSLPPGQQSAWSENADRMLNPQAQMFDLITTLNLVGSFDLHSVEEEEAEEEATCAPCPECPEPAPCAAEPIVEPTAEPAAQTAEPVAEAAAEPAPVADAEAAPEPAADAPEAAGEAPPAPAE